MEERREQKDFLKKRKWRVLANHEFVPWDLSCGHNLLFPYFIITRVTLSAAAVICPPSFWGKLSSTASICRAQSVRGMSTDYFRCCNSISFTFLDFLESHLPAEDAPGFVSKAAACRGCPALKCMSLAWKLFPSGAWISSPERRYSLLRTGFQQVCKSLNAKSLWDNC